MGLDRTPGSRSDLSERPGGVTPDDFMLIAGGRLGQWANRIRAADISQRHSRIAPQHPHLCSPNGRPAKHLQILSVRQLQKSKQIDAL